MEKTYIITTDSRDYRTPRSSEAASVAAAWKRQGLAPRATVVVVVPNGPLWFSAPVPVTTAKATAKALATTAPA